MGLANTASDVQVELNVQASTADAELRLPFLRSEVTLVRAVMDSQTLILGDRIRQDSEAILWRAQDTERHILRLILRPRALTQREGRGFLSISIPAIPMARLEIQSESLNDWRDITIDSIGSAQSDSFRTLSARLGPINRLNVSWPISSARSGPTQVQSDSWIHTRGDKVMAMCQLRMRGMASLHGAVTVLGDANWIPVGQTWEDFRFVTSEGTSSTGRPIFSIEKLPDRTGDELTLKVLMLPRDEAASSLSLPFLALQQPASPASRTLALSHTDSPQWKMVGAEWPALLSSQAAQFWNGTRMGEQPSLWKVPSGSVQNTLQRIATPPSPAVAETTDVQLLMPETKIKYVARWSSPSVGLPTVRFHVPNHLRLDSVLVDALAARYSVHKLADSSNTNELVVFIDSSLNGHQSINLQFSTPTRLNRAFRLPRPILLQSEILSSTVQVYHGVELASTHGLSDENGPKLEKLDGRADLLLQQLHLPIGRLDLGNQWRDKPELPLDFTLTRATPSRSGRSLLRFTRTEQGWRGHFDAIVENKNETSPVFIEIPRSLESSLKEPLESNSAMMLWPSADSNRALLAVLPERSDATQSHVSFTFKLPNAGASQSINIPDVRVLGLSSPRPALALPTTVGGEQVRWTGIGMGLPKGWLDQFAQALPDLSTFDLFEPVDSQSQATWQPREQREKDIELMLTSITLDRLSARDNHTTPRAHTTSGQVNYWCSLTVNRL